MREGHIPLIPLTVLRPLMHRCINLHLRLPTPYPALTVFARYLPTACRLLGGASPASSSCNPPSVGPSILSRSYQPQALSLCLFTLFPAICPIPMSPLQPLLLLPILRSPHHSLSWRLLLQSLISFPVNLFLELYHSSLLPITTPPLSPSHSATCNSSLLPANYSHAPLAPPYLPRYPCHPVPPHPPLFQIAIPVPCPRPHP